MRWMIGQVSEKRVAGSYLEAGVWRGGMSIFATAALQVHGLQDRPVYICDSFKGLPKPRVESPRPDEIFYARNRMNNTLSVGGVQHVLANFDRFGVPRHRVTAVVGYFVDSLPPLREALLSRDERLAILRLDGDSETASWALDPHPATPPSASPLPDASYTMRVRATRTRGWGAPSLRRRCTLPHRPFIPGCFGEQAPLLTVRHTRRTVKPQCTIARSTFSTVCMTA